MKSTLKKWLPLLVIAQACICYFFLYILGCSAPPHADPVANYSVANVGNLTIEAGHAQTLGLNIAQETGTASSISLVVNGIDNAVATLTLTPTSGTPPFTSNLEFTVPATAVPGTYPYTLTASGEGIANKTYTGNLVITAATTTAGDYSVANVGDIGILFGSTRTLNLDITQVSGTASTVSLTVSGLNANVATTTLTPSSGTPPFTSALQFTVPASAAAGTYPYTVTASGEGIPNKTYTGNLIVVYNNCAPDRAGNYTGTRYAVQAQTTETSFPTIISEVPAMPNRIKMLENVGSHNYWYADLNCNPQTLAIPHQTVTNDLGASGFEVEGYGTFDGNELTYTYAWWSGGVFVDSMRVVTYK